MTEKLKVVALMSGGKDSLFSILHCLAQGHEVVALANLHPPLASEDGSSEGEDMNSYMYQTVGHSIIPLYAEALGLPLFRQEISGSAVNTSRDYTATETGDDETESLIPLLKKVLASGLGVNAVSTGAILSTYQRTRVESVALRLGLTPLSYLWQYPYLPPYSQSGLLHDMAAVGQDARIIKVASGGLDDSFLWQNVADAKTITRLGRAMTRFGTNGDGAVVGEGGEFETLAVDGPSVLWKRRIEVEDGGVIRGEGGTYIFNSKGARLVEKEDGTTTGLEDLRVPSMWDAEFEKVLEAVSPATMSIPDPSVPLSNIPTTTPFSNFPTYNINQLSPAQTLAISNDCSPLTGPQTPFFQLQIMIHNLEEGLQTRLLAPTDITHATLLLRRMSDFTTLNPLYGSLFDRPNPPSRVTVACGDMMPEGVDVMLSVLVARDMETKEEYAKRNGLHVQSRSYWAPANIGPYSQAIGVPIARSPRVDVVEEDDEDTSEQAGAHPEAVYIAGQIPLVPASMQVYNERGFEGQAVLALQHLWRIGRAMKICWWTPGVAYLSSSASSASEMVSRVHIAQEAWKSIHDHYLDPLPFSGSGSDSDDEADIDPWDRQNTYTQTFDDTTYRSPIPDPAATSELIAPPCFVVQVESLPRDVDIEWHSTGLSSCKLEILDSPSINGGGHVIRVLGTDTRFFSIDITSVDSVEAVKNRLGDFVWEHATLYASAGLGLSSGYASVVEALQWIPCKRVWGADGVEVRGVIVGRCTLQ